MDFQEEASRIYLLNEAGETIAEVTFPEEDGVFDITHTFVDGSLRGQGIADQLIRRVAARLREEGKKAKLTCSYAQKWFAAHPEEQDLVATEMT